MIPLRLVFKNITRHPLRSLLTAGSLAVAVFLLAALHAFTSALNSTVDAAEDDRVIVQSAVSLFVNLPLSYQTKINSVEGVQSSCMWLWFGGYYKDPENFFAQFGVDQDTMDEVYPEFEVVKGSMEAFQKQRTSCLIGAGLAEKYGWEVGSRVPIIGNIYTKPGNEAFEFDVAGIYEPTKKSFDRSTLFFHHDYIREALESGVAFGPEGTSTYSVKIAPGSSATAVMAGIDGLFQNGPQRTQTVPESTFNAQFLSMWGNLPQFVGAIGLGVLFAVLLACVNTMLMAARQQTRDVGVLKSLGFTDTSTSIVLLLQSFLLCLLGGGIGLALALALPGLTGGAMESFVPGYRMGSSTIIGAIVVTVGVGLLAGILPAWRAHGLTPVAALRSEG